MAIYKEAPFKKTTEFLNSSVSKIIASKQVGKEILDRSYVDNAAAKAAGLVDGDIYHTAGLLKVVYTP
jgi:uncharacterized phage protein gp47/JayE